MKQEARTENDIAAITALLTEDNKRYVIAVASALLFTQQNKEKEYVCRPCSECTS